MQDENQLSATADLNVYVLFARNQPPFFVNLPYVASVYENASLVSVVSVLAVLPQL